MSARRIPEARSDPLRHQHAGHRPPRYAAARAGARPDVPVIMITAYGDTETRRKAIEGAKRGSSRGDRSSRVARRDRAPAGCSAGTPWTAKILVVDDEADLEDLVTQNSAVRSGWLDRLRLRARRGAGAGLPRREPRFRHGRIRHQHAAHGRIDAPGETAGRATRFSTVIVSAYGDMANIRTGDEPGRVRLSHQADRLRRLRGHRPQDRSPMSATSGTRASASGGRRARARLSLALFLAQSRPQPCRRLNALVPGGERRQIATLFTDIAGFTPLVELLDPKQLAVLLSGHPSMTQSFSRTRARWPRSSATRIHVLFGAPATSPTPPPARSLARSRSTCALRPTERMEGSRRVAGRHADRRSCGTGDRRQFRRRASLRLHGLRRHHQCRGAARGGQQATRHAHLRQRCRCRAG